MTAVVFSALPYRLHTNYELGLMLRGEKPLAYFADVRGAEPVCVARYLKMFDRHVGAGRLIKRVASLDIAFADGSPAVFDRILYALPAEEWRIEAMLALLDEPGVWTDERERRQGTLLGYEDWQNEAWLGLREAG